MLLVIILSSISVFATGLTRIPSIDFEDGLELILPKIDHKGNVNLSNTSSFFDVTSDTPVTLSGTWRYFVTNDANNAGSIEVRFIDKNGKVMYGPTEVALGNKVTFNVSSNQKYTIQARAMSRAGYYRIVVTD